MSEMGRLTTKCSRSPRRNLFLRGFPSTQTEEEMGRRRRKNNSKPIDKQINLWYNISVNKRKVVKIMRNLENLKGIKYYAVYWDGYAYDGTHWGGYSGYFATREDAEEYVKKEQENSYNSYEVVEKVFLN